MSNTIAEQVVSLISTLEPVKEWLLSKPDDEIVGFSCLSQSCLLAQFLAEKGFSVSIGNVFDLTTFAIEGEGKLRDLPDKAMDYASRLDEETISYLESSLRNDEVLEDLYPNYPSVPITALIALKVLSTLMR